MACDLSKVQWTVGLPFTPDLAAKAKADAGVEWVRPLRPDQMVTMEYNESRLNIDLDENDVVIRVRSG